MKQKVLGATLVLSAPVNSFASYSSKGDGKVDLSKLEKVDALTGLEITINDGVKLKLSDLNVKNGSKFVCDKEAFKKDDYNVTLDLGDKETKVDEGIIICVHKILTEEDGKNLKLEAMSSFDKLDAGSYVIISSADKKKSIKIERKGFDKQQKLSGDKKGFEDNKEK